MKQLKENYQITEHLYESANSLIYRAIQLVDGRSVILKILKDPYPTPERVAWFRHEYELIHSLKLDGVIQVYRLEESSIGWVMVLEDFEGDSLAQLGIAGKIDYSSFFAIALQITDILGQLHQRQIIHKDINPTNIVFNAENGQVKLIDFGISTKLSRENPTFRSPNGLEGTLAYISPEQTGRMNRHIDYRTDFYALGVTFYELLTGQLPFTEGEPLALLHSHIAKQPIAPHELKASVPPMLSAIVLKLMAKNAEERYQSAHGLYADLARCQQLVENDEDQRSTLEPFPLGQQDRSERLHLSQRLYGRDAEISTLLNTFEQVTVGKMDKGASRSPCLLLIAGYSGVGKTALVHEIYKPITQKRGLFIEGTYPPVHLRTPYAGLGQALNSLCTQLLMESPQQLQIWKRRISDAVGNNGRVLLEIAPDIVRIIGEQPAVAQVGAKERENRFYLVFQSFMRAICRPAHPMVLFLDDLQWVDWASLRLLKLLMEDDQCQGLLILGAYRVNEVDESHRLSQLLAEICQEQGEQAVKICHLQNLSATDVCHFIADSLTSTCAAIKPLSDLIYDKTQGNAFFTTTLLASLYAENTLTFCPDIQAWQWKVEQIQAKQASENVIDLMVEQIRHLPLTSQTMLQYAACIGSQFDLTLLMKLCSHHLLEQVDNSAHLNSSDVVAALWPALQEGMIHSLGDAYQFMVGQIARTDVTDNAVVSLPTASLQGQFKFQHDRIQQAAYSLVPPNQKSMIHQRIGHLLLEQSGKGVGETTTDSALFEIVNHLNKGWDEEADKGAGNGSFVNHTRHIELAELNLQAGQSAKSATAYEIARLYLQKGIALCGGSGENSHSQSLNPSLILTLNQELAEVAYLATDYELAQRQVEFVQSHALTLTDKIKAVELQMQICMAQNQMQAAIDLGYQALRWLDVPLRTDPPQELSIDQIRTLPEMTDPTALSALRILVALFAPTIIVAPQQLSTVVFTLVDHSHQHGNAPLTAFAYVAYGMMLCGMMGSIERGVQFGKLALEIVEQFDAQEVKCRVYTLYHSFVAHWQEHLQSATESLAETIQVGLETGDLEYVGYATVTYTRDIFLTGEPLAVVAQKQATSIQLLQNLKQAFQLNITKLIGQLILNLQGEATEPSQLNGRYFNEDEMLPFWQDAQMPSELFTLYMAKSILNYWIGNYAEAITNAAEARQYEQTVAGLSLNPQYNFYESLALLANANIDKHEGVAEGRDRATAHLSTLEQVAQNQAKLKRWASLAPMNLQHKVDLVEAEEARLRGQVEEAMRSYEQAIQGANRQGYLQEEAISYERAAYFYESIGYDKFANLYLREAHYRYQSWGAMLKVRALESAYPLLYQSSLYEPSLDRLPGGTVAESTTRLTVSPTQHLTYQSTYHQTIQPHTQNTVHRLGHHQTLDLASMVKASQAISSEIVLGRLLEEMMKIVMENAGATRGLFILAHEQTEDADHQPNSLEQTKQLRWTIEAEVANDSEQPKPFKPIPLLVDREEASMSGTPASRVLIPHSVVHYVIHSQAQVVLNRAMEEGMFTTDPYIMDDGPLSILCLPLIHQGKPKGILYLENELSTDAFTPEQLTVLALLSNQMAISLDNAVLYGELQQHRDHLEELVADRTKALSETVEHLQATQSQLIESEKMAALGGLVAGVAHEINTPIGIGVMAASTLESELNEIATSYERGQVRRSTWESYLNMARQSSQLLLNNLHRAAELVQSFKQVAVDQTTLERRPFEVRGYIEDALLSLKPKLTGTAHRLAVVGEENITIYSYPGALSQIITNLVMNSINHAYPDGGSGQLCFQVTKVQDRLQIIYTDDGRGISKENLKRIFEPFFTTARNQGGTGLGLHIVYNLVAQKLAGAIHCDSQEGAGTKFTIEIPMGNNVST